MAAELKLRSSPGKFRGSELMRFSDVSHVRFYKQIGKYNRISRALLGAKITFQQMLKLILSCAQVALAVLRKRTPPAQVKAATLAMHKRRRLE